jgi:hypothetical protein
MPPDADTDFSLLPFFQFFAIISRCREYRDGARASVVAGALCCASMIYERTLLPLLHA